MKTTLTVRLDERQARTIAETARRLGRSMSEIVRDALDAALTERTIAERAGQYKGRLNLPQGNTPDRRGQIRARNWRP